MKKMPKVTVKHSSAMKNSDINSHNKSQQKLRDSWLKMGQTQEDVERMFPFDTLETYTDEPGFYGKFGGTRGGGWRGPYETEQLALEGVGEIAFESTFG